MTDAHTDHSVSAGVKSELFRRLSRDTRRYIPAALIPAAASLAAVAVLITYFAGGSHFESCRALYLPALALLLTEVFFLNLGAAYQADQRAGRYAASRGGGAALGLAVYLTMLAAFREITCRGLLGRSGAVSL